MAGREYCRDKAAPEGSSLYYATLFHGDRTRQGLITLFALYYELLDGFFTASDPGVARMKLQWWREELDRLAAGQPRHPVTKELQALGGSVALDSDALTILPDAVEALFPPAYDGDVHTWLSNAGVSRFWRQAASLAVGGTAGAGETGMLLTRLEQLQHLRPVLQLGFQPLPEAVLARHGIHRDDLLLHPAADPVSAASAELVQAIAAGLENSYRLGRKENPLFVLILNRLGTATCGEIGRDGYALLRRRVALTPIRKLWIAVRTRYARRLA
jgi:phytoene synthase